MKQRLPAPWREKRPQAGFWLSKFPKLGRRATVWYTYLRIDRGPVGKRKERIGKTDDDSCGVCGVQETDWHLVIECPLNERHAKQASMEPGLRLSSLASKRQDEFS